MSYSAKAVKVSGDHPVDPQPCPAGTRGDFIRALRILGARVGAKVADPECADQEVQFVAIRCGANTWNQVFGEPQSVTCHNDPLLRQPFHAWRHTCTDGPLTCIGHIFTPGNGETQISLGKLGFF